MKRYLPFRDWLCLRNVVQSIWPEAESIIVNHRARVIIPGFQSPQEKSPDVRIIEKCAEFGLSLECAYSRIWNPRNRPTEWAGDFVPSMALEQMSPVIDLHRSIRRFLAQEFLRDPDHQPIVPDWPSLLEFFGGFIGLIQPDHFVYLEALASPDSIDAHEFRLVELAFFLSKLIRTGANYCQIEIAASPPKLLLNVYYVLKQPHDSDARRNFIYLIKLANQALHEPDYAKWAFLGALSGFLNPKSPPF